MTGQANATPWQKKKSKMTDMKRGALMGTAITS